MSSNTKPRKNKIKRIILWGLSPLGLILALAILWFPLSKFNVLPHFMRTAAFKPLQTPETRDGRWQQDLDYYASQLPRLHKDLYHHTDKETFDTAIVDLEADIPDLTDEEIIVRLMGITALVGDGHTSVGLNALYDEPFNFETVPLGVKWYADGWYVIGGLPEYRDLIGAELVAIEGTFVDEVAEIVGEVVSHDNQMQLHSQTTSVMMMPDVLYGLGLVDQTDAVTMTFQTEDGEQTLTVESVGREALQDAITVEEFFGEDNVPLARQHEDQWYWYEFLEDKRTVYFQYDVCGNMDDLRFKDFNAKMFQFIDANEVEQIVVDLRYNGGGNSLVLKSFLNALEERPNLEVAALIGRQTFSSGLMNAVQLDRQGATLVGEPTGGRPNHYGEVRPFRLPNSGLSIYYSTRYFREIEDADPPSLEPDIPVTLTIGDQLNGYDAALEEALNIQTAS